MQDISPKFSFILTATMVSSFFLLIALAILSCSLLVNVHGQVCNNALQYSACSSNSNCGCLLYSFSDTTGVCGLLTQSCSSFVACQAPNDACSQSGYVCVRHPQCGSNALCYPSTMFDQSSCPRMPVSNYSSALTVNSQNYTRHGGAGSYYYEAIEVRVATTGSYRISSSGTIADNFGYLYQGNFYPSLPQYNIITSNDDATGRNFGFTVTLRSDITYILVVTTLQPGGTGSFTITTSDPANVSLTPIYT